jgi:hypothetical protein
MTSLHRSSYLELPEYGAVRARVRRASYRWRELYHTAIQRFGEINAWRVSKFFSVEHLSSGKTHERSPNFSYDHHMLDHLDHFRCNRKPVAIVCHDYPGAAKNLREYIATIPDLVLHEPAEGREASWYSPDTWPMCITRSDYEAAINWLSPQDLQLLRAAEAELQIAQRAEIEISQRR